VGMSGQLVEKSSSGGYTHDTHDWEGEQDREDKVGGLVVLVYVQPLTLTLGSC
jgi:hypothetical protein